MWIITVGDDTVESDDFTIEDLGAIEKATSTPWSIANPVRDVKVARAFLAVAMSKLGKSNREIEVALNAMTLRTLKRTFDYKPEDEAGEVAAEADPTQRPTSQKSSRGRPLKGGSRPIPDASDLVTSS